MKNTRKEQDLDKIEVLDLSKLSAALRHLSDATDQLNALLPSNNMEEHDEDNEAVKRWFLLSDHQQGNHE